MLLKMLGQRQPAPSFMYLSVNNQHHVSPTAHYAIMLHFRQCGGVGLHELFSLRPIKNIIHEVMRGAIHDVLELSEAISLRPIKINYS